MRTNPLAAFFGVVIDRRPWLGLVYLLLAFPLGIAYFVLLVTGWSLGLGTLILWIGAIVLLGLIAFSFVLSLFERLQTVWLLSTPVGPAWQRPLAGLGFWARLKALLANRVTWTGMLFQLLKFPFGVAAFVFVVTAFSLSGALLAAPIYYSGSPPDFFWWVADTLPEALLCSLAGALLLVVSLHAVKGIAWAWGRLAALMLGRREPPTGLDGEANHPGLIAPVTA